jgi:hypothetical protein
MKIKVVTEMCVFFVCLSACRRTTGRIFVYETLEGRILFKICYNHMVDAHIFEIGMTLEPVSKSGTTELSRIPC